MPFQDGDKEFFRQLAWVYPVEYVQELEQLAAEVLKEQLREGERQSIREIVDNIMEKIRNTPDDDATDKALEIAKQENYLAAETQALSERTASLLAEGQAGFLAGFGPQVAAHLAAALNDKSAAVAATAREALLNLEDGGTIDAFCQLWEETRRPDLENILIRKGYLAVKPLMLRVLTVLKTGAASYMLAMNQETLAAILKATDDNDGQIAARAEEMLLSLDNQDFIDIFCQMALDNPANKKLLSIAAAGRYAPSAPPLAAFFYCLTGQWEEYYALDRQESRPLLQKGYAEAAKAEKEAFLALALREGHSRLAVEILLSCDKKQELLKISESVWKTIIENIAARQDLEFLAGLILQAPPEFSRKITLLLRQANWEPPREEWRKLLSLYPPDSDEKDFFAPDGREFVSLALDEPGIKPECLAFHPDEPLLAAGGSDGVVRFWRLGDSQPWRTVTLTEYGICALTFTPDGRFLVTAFQDGKVNIWNMPAVTWAASVKGQAGQALGIAANNAGHILAAVKDSPASPLIRLWHWDGAAMTNKALLPQSMFALPAIHPNLRQAVGVTAGRQIRVWPPKAGRNLPLTLPNREEPLALAITPCGCLAGAIAADGCLHIWSVETGQLLASMPARKTRQGGMALSGQGDLAAVTCPENNTITVYQARWTKPLAVATRADLAYAAKMAESQNDNATGINTYQYLAALLSAKFQKGD